MSTINQRIQLAGKSAATLASSNPVLLARELAFETDTGKAKLGDGSTAWNSLPYLSLDPLIGAIAALGTTGLIVRASSASAVARTITGTANEISVANGSGVGGNPTVSLPSAITLTGKTIEGGAFSNGTFDASAAYKLSGTQVVGARKTGWTAATGTAQRSGYAAYTAPTISNPPTQAEVQAIANAVQDVSRTLKALIDDLHASAGHGLIGT